MNQQMRQAATPPDSERDSGDGVLDDGLDLLHFDEAADAERSFGSGRVHAQPKLLVVVGLSVIVLVVMFLVIGRLVRSANPVADTNSYQPAQAWQQSTSSPQVVTINSAGVPVPVGALTVTIGSATWHDQWSSARPVHRFLAIEVSVSNDSESAANISQSFEFIGADGLPIAVDQTATATLADGSSNPLTATELAPGAQLSGVVVFDLSDLDALDGFLMWGSVGFSVNL